MKNLLFVLATILIVSGCTKQQATDTVKAVECTLQSTVVSLTAAAITEKLACANTDAVKAAVLVQANKLNSCDPAAAPATGVVSTNAITAKSAVGDFVCAPLVSGLVTGALANIPADWKCTGGAVTEAVKAQLLASCQKAL